MKELGGVAGLKAVGESVNPLCEALLDLCLNLVSDSPSLLICSCNFLW